MEPVVLFYNLALRFLQTQPAIHKIIRTSFPNRDPRAPPAEPPPEGARAPPASGYPSPPVDACVLCPAPQGQINPRSRGENKPAFCTSPDPVPRIRAAAAGSELHAAASSSTRSPKIRPPTRALPTTPSCSHLRPTSEGTAESYRACADSPLPRPSLLAVVAPAWLGHHPSCSAPVPP